MQQLTANSIRSLLAGGQISTLLSVLHQFDDDKAVSVGPDLRHSYRRYGRVFVETLYLSDGARLVDIKRGRDIKSYRLQNGVLVTMPAGTSAAAELRRLQRRCTVH